MAVSIENSISMPVVVNSTAASALVQVERSRAQSTVPANAEYIPVGGQGLPQDGQAVAAEQTQAKSPEADLSGLSDAVSKLNDHMQVIRRNLKFTLDEDLGRMVVTVTDAETNEVVRQIPSEETLAVAKNLQGLKGLLLKTEV